MLSAIPWISMLAYGEINFLHMMRFLYIYTCFYFIAFLSILLELHIIFQFLYMQPEDLVMKKQLVEELKEEVKKELIRIKGSNEPMHHIKLIELIDAVQRLGIAYHFEEEIEEALQQIHVTYGEQWVDKENLQSISLWFRLLRQQGFNVSSGLLHNLTLHMVICNSIIRIHKSNL